MRQRRYELHNDLTFIGNHLILVFERDIIDLARSIRFNQWRPVRESNPCRRREREAIYRNSKETCGMDSTVR
jgi:hypothetical protein